MVSWSYQEDSDGSSYGQRTYFQFHLQLTLDLQFASRGFVEGGIG